MYNKLGCSRTTLCFHHFNSNFSSIRLYINNIACTTSSDVQGLLLVLITSMTIYTLLWYMTTPLMSYISYIIKTWRPWYKIIYMKWLLTFNPLMDLTVQILGDTATMKLKYCWKWRWTPYILSDATVTIDWVVIQTCLSKNKHQLQCHSILYGSDHYLVKKIHADFFKHNTIAVYNGEGDRFIGGENWRSGRKPVTSRKFKTNLKTMIVFWRKRYHAWRLSLVPTSHYEL